MSAPGAWIPRVHRVLGPVMLVVFALSGAYMRSREPAVADEVRYQFRLNHLLLLMVGLVHLGLAGCPIATAPWPRRLQSLGALVMLASAPLLLAAFFVEPPSGSPLRPLTGFGVYTLALGTLLQAVGAWAAARTAQGLPTARRS